MPSVSVSAESAAPAYAIVSERGPGNFVIDRFEHEADARRKAARYFACHVLFHQRPADGSLAELATGGYGLGRTFRAIRRHAHAALDPHAVRFANRPDRPLVDPAVAPERRVTLGVVFPLGVAAPAVFIAADGRRPVQAAVDAALAHAGVALERGRLPGSPERVNLFTLDGEIVRLDLELEAHLGRTLRAGDALALERGNRLPPSRVEAIRRALD
jgi:hypothetical protein